MQMHTYKSQLVAISQWNIYGSFDAPSQLVIFELSQLGVSLC